MKKDFTSILDRTTEELTDIIFRGIEFKRARINGNRTDTHLQDQYIGLIFEKHSTRTRVSFEVGIKELGGNSIFLPSGDIQLSRGESIEDTSKVLSGYLDCLIIRTFSQSKLDEFAKHASIPIINALTDEYHPCQIMADVMTIYETFGTLNKFKVAYIGDGNNIAHSWLNAAARLGFHISIASPKGYEIDIDIYKKAIDEAKKSGAKIHICNDPGQSIQDADVVSTDTWTSMGQEATSLTKFAAFNGFTVNSTLMKKAKPSAIFLHCLPAHIGEEVTPSVFRSTQSKVYEEANNRLHVQKAILANVFNK